MTPNFGLSKSYDHNRRDFHAARTQREAGIEHLEWDDEREGYPIAWYVLNGLALLSASFGLFCLYCSLVGQQPF